MYLYATVLTGCREQAVLLRNRRGWIAPQEVQDERKCRVRPDRAKLGSIHQPSCPHFETGDMIIGVQAMVEYIPQHVSLYS